MIIQVTTSEMIILLLYNIKLRNIQKTITAFENENNFEDQPCLMKVFLLIIQAMTVGLLLQHQT